MRHEASLGETREHPTEACRRKERICHGHHAAEGGSWANVHRARKADSRARELNSGQEVWFGLSTGPLESAA